MKKFRIAKLRTLPTFPITEFLKRDCRMSATKYWKEMKIIQLYHFA